MAETRTRRKIIQIAVTGESGGGSQLFALTDDGGVWALVEVQDKYTWREIPSPPDRVEFEDANPRARSR